MADSAYTPASAPLGDFLAGVHYSKYLEMVAQTELTLQNGLTGTLPQGSQVSEGRVQSDAGAPIVQIWDLKNKGVDRTTIDMVGRYTAEPVVNDASALEHKENLDYERDEVSLKLLTHLGGNGGIMSDFRNPHDIRMNVMVASVEWMKNVDDGLAVCHMAGTRGSGFMPTIPLKTASSFTSIVGTLLPPTRNRYAVASGVASDGPGTIDSANVLTLNGLARMRAAINTSPVPMPPVKLTSLDKKVTPDKRNTRLYIGLLSEEQYVTIQEAETNRFKELVTNANTRVDFESHPAFADLERFLWAGVLWFKCPRAVSVESGESIDQYNATTLALETVTANARFHRGLILGAQALGVAYGDASGIKKGSAVRTGEGMTDALKSPYSWAEDVRQGDSILDIYVRQMAGRKKLRYTWNGVAYDNGVFAFDSYQAGL